MNNAILDRTAGFALFVAIILYLVTIAVSLWIGYLLMRTAVKNGTIQAHEELARRDAVFMAQRERAEARSSTERALADIRAERAKTAEALDRQQGRRP